MGTLENKPSVEILNKVQATNAIEALDCGMPFLHNNELYILCEQVVKKKSTVYAVNLKTGELVSPSIDTLVTPVKIKLYITKTVQL
jgi:hypothetical protein